MPISKTMNRRDALVALGATGVGALLTGQMVSWSNAAGTVTQHVYGPPWEGVSCIHTSLDGLRGVTSPSVQQLYYVTDPGKEGFFRYDAQDTSSADNTGTVVVSSSGARFKRQCEPGCVNVRWFGAKGDGATDDTAAINQAVGDGNIIVYVPPGTYCIRADAAVLGQLDAGIELKDNTTLVIHPQANLKALPTSSKRYTIINVFNKQNVRIEGGGSIVGERDEHMGTGGEWGYGIAIGGSEHVVVQDITLSHCWGDGAVLSAFPKGTPSRDIVFERVRCRSNRRQGVSVIGVEGALFDSCTFELTEGTLPQAGMDLEPDKGDTVTSVTIRNCLFDQNAGGACILNGMNGTVEQVVLDNNRFHGKVSVMIASNVTLSRNVIDTTRMSLYISTASDCLVEGNRFFHSDDRAIEVRKSTGIQMCSNQFRNIRSNILYLSQSNFCSFVNNRSDECGDVINSTDVMVASGSSYNLIHGNSIRNRLKYRGTVVTASAAALVLGDDASSISGEYEQMIVYIVAGTGAGQ